MKLKQAVGLLVVALMPIAVNAKHYPITGVKIAPGADVPIRRNINDLYAEGGPQWELYLRALKSLQEKDADDPLSYFQLMGIHGLPFIEWNECGPFHATGWKGYCPHGENIFLSWHRVYVLLFEQVLVEEAKIIAATYPQSYRRKYITAARTLRSPFWDSASDARVPPCTVPQQMTVRVPDGKGLKSLTIKNPLLSFTYPEAARTGKFKDFPTYPFTSRCPSPDSYPDSANGDLTQRGMKQSTYDSFTYSKTFDEFTATRSDGGEGLEQIHDYVHWDAGCGGEFLNSTTCAYDPLFMLLHTNVDRLYTYWTYINPSQATFTDSYRGHSRYSTPRHSVITPDSPLEPFYDDSDTYWTPNKASSLEGMGYTYEGLDYRNMTPEQLKTSATQLVKSHYGPDENHRRGLNIAIRFNTRYFVHVTLEREEVQRPCSVNIFVNGKSAGKVIVMQLPETGTLNGRVAIDTTIEEAFSLFPNNGSISSIAHLVEVGIRKVDGSIIPLETVPSFKLTLEEVDMFYNSRIELPTPGERKKHSITTVKDRNDNRKASAQGSNNRQGLGLWLGLAW